MKVDQLETTVSEQAAEINELKGKIDKLERELYKVQVCFACVLKFTFSAQSLQTPHT